MAERITTGTKDENEILSVGNNVEVTGLDKDGHLMGALYAHIDDLQRSGETVVIHCTDVWGRKHAVIAQESSDGKLSNLVQAWGTNTPVTRVYGPVLRARVSIWNRRLK